MGNNCKRRLELTQDDIDRMPAGESVIGGCYYFKGFCRCCGKSFVVSTRALAKSKKFCSVDCAKDKRKGQERVSLSLYSKTSLGCESYTKGVDLVVLNKR